MNRPDFANFGVPISEAPGVSVGDSIARVFRNLDKEVTKIFDSRYQWYDPKDEGASIEAVLFPFHINARESDKLEASR